MTCEKVLLNKFFPNLVESNTTNFVKDTFIFPLEDICKKRTPGCERLLGLQKSVWNLKKSRILTPDKC